MTIQELMRGIELPEKAQRIVLDYEMEEDEYLSWKEMFKDNFSFFLEKWKEKEDSKQWILSFYVKMSGELYEKYVNANISEDIYYDTFRDITIWCQECYCKYGIYGLEEVEWLAKSIRMELYRIGRLQYEPMVIKNDEESDLFHLNIGEKVLNVHIPAGEKLDYMTCVDSMRTAQKFFGQGYTAMVCESWLLSPKLKEVLPETSNIIRFQELFQIVQEHYKFPQAEERIFKTWKSNKAEYPEETTLQRNAKNYLLSGGSIGIGVGVISIP